MDSPFLLLLGLLIGLLVGLVVGVVLSRSRTAPGSSEFTAGRLAVEGLVAPLREALGRVETHLRGAEQGRAATQASLEREMCLLREASEAVRSETGALVTALRRPHTRGRWGEIQLRRVVELAGMVAHCDFEEQPISQGPDGALRPDLVVRLAGGRQVVVDAKVPLAAYLEAVDTPDGSVRDGLLDAHARQLRHHVDALSAKRYWERFAPSPEFVVLFVPGDPFLAAALEHDPALLEDAARRRVVLATPMTLIALLRTVSYAWRQDTVARDAQQVLDLGREIYERLRTMGTHVDRLGRSLGGAVSAYNEAVGSLESRVLVSARRFQDAGLVEDDLPPPQTVDAAPRRASAPELVDADPASVLHLDAPIAVPRRRARGG